MVINRENQTVSKHHFMRLKNLLSNRRVSDSIVHGGLMDEEHLFIEPTVLLDPSVESEPMTEEIFGPLLPIITLEKTIGDLRLYKKNETFRKRLAYETSSGSLVFNDAIIQYAANTLLFGGIGECGTGKYHGKYSFEMFSHYKAVARRSFLTDFWFRFPPWNDHKLQLMRTAYN